MDFMQFALFDSFGSPGWTVLIALVLGLIPTTIAIVRRHHQAFAIIMLSMLPGIALLVLFIGTVVSVKAAVDGFSGGIGLFFSSAIASAVIQTYVLPIAWFTAMVWSATRVARFAAAAPPPQPSAAGAGASKSVWQLTPEERAERRRAERRRRGY